MEAGQIIAYSQLAVKEKSCCGHCTSKQASTPAGKNVKAKLIDRKGEADPAVVTPDLTLKISRATGLISPLTCQGKSLLGEGGTLKPNFSASSHRQRHGRWSAEEVQVVEAA